MAGGSPPGSSLVARTLDVLGAFDEQHSQLRLTDIAERADLSAPTALRIVRVLADGGALQHLPDGRYAVGRRIWEIGLLAPEQTGLREVASPYLQDLHAATRATVHLAERDGTDVLYLDRHSGMSSVPIVSRVGSRLPLHCTGVGKVLLAHAPADVRHACLRRLTRQTAYTITSVAVLNRQLGRVHRDGYATTAEEMSLGACSVAVPIRDGDQVIAALGVVVPHLRQRARLVSALTVAAASISRQVARGSTLTS